MDIPGNFRRATGTACRACKRAKIRCDLPGADTTEQPQPCTACRRRGVRCTTADEDKASVSRFKHRRIQRSRTESASTAPTSSIIIATPSCSPACASLEQQTPSSTSSALVPEDALKDFYERGVRSNDWNIFAASDKDPLRIVYTGSTIANLNHLVQHRSLHFPFPSIRPRLSWEPSPASRAYMTVAAARDLSHLPPREVRDSLVDTYFSCIHPGLPIIDAAEFHHQYASADPSPPLLLLQCMLLAAARVSKHPVVLAARSELTAKIYNRAKTLFEMRHENDRVILVQAALLLTWHVEDSDLVSNGPYHWIGLAMRTALGLGMHRDLSDSSASLMPAPDRRLYRRLWWAVLRLEVFSCMEYGRPPMVRLEDFDQTALKHNDFISGDGSNDTLARPDYCILDSRLCVLALEIMKLSAPGNMYLDEEGQAIDQHLVMLAAELPSTLDFWSCQLRITHSLLALLLHRVRKRLDLNSTFVAQEAVSTILVTFETILAQDNIANLHYFACTPLLAAAIHFAQTVTEAAEPSSMKAYTAHVQLERLLKPIEALAKNWPQMESVYRLSTLLLTHCKRVIFPAAPAAQQESFDLVDITLDDLLGEYCFPNFVREVG